MEKASPRGKNLVWKSGFTASAYSVMLLVYDNVISGGPMRIATCLILPFTFGMLAGCEDEDGGRVHDEMLSRYHEIKAVELCKRDKGFRRIVEASGMNFTAECKSGIFVNGVAERTR